MSSNLPHHRKAIPAVGCRKRSVSFEVSFHVISPTQIWTTRIIKNHLHLPPSSPTAHGARAPRPSALWRPARPAPLAAPPGARWSERPRRRPAAAEASTPGTPGRRPACPEGVRGGRRRSEGQAGQMNQVSSNARRLDSCSRVSLYNQFTK